MTRVHHVLLSFVAVAVVALASACGGRSPEGAYDVLPRGDVHRAMWRVQTAVDELDRLMQSTDPADIDNDQVIALLERMAAAVTDLERESRKDHPLLEDNLGAFDRSVSRALAGARASPPNYYYAGAVTGACVYCHDPRGGLQTGK